MGGDSCLARVGRARGGRGLGRLHQERLMAKKTNPVESVSKVKNAHGMPAKIAAAGENMTAMWAEFADEHDAAATADEKNAVVTKWTGLVNAAIAEGVAGLSKGKD